MVRTPEGVKMPKDDIPSLLKIVDNFGLNHINSPDFCHHDNEAGEIHCLHCNPNKPDGEDVRGMVPDPGAGSRMFSYAEACSMVEARVGGGDTNDNRLHKIDPNDTNWMKKLQPEEFNSQVSFDLFDL